MRTVGIICEYNPFHKGHLRQLRLARELAGEDCAVVCLMSGNYVQRGEPAIFPKTVRAEAALRCGADLVLELPLTAALSSAEGFAAGGVSILTALGCDDLCYGIETENNNLIMSTAKANLDPAFDALLRTELAAGCSYPAARQRAIDRLVGAGAHTGPLPEDQPAPNAVGALSERPQSLPLEGKVARPEAVTDEVAPQMSALSHPNDILAVEYCKAILKQNSPMKPLPIRRTGAYHAEILNPEAPSATALRAALRSARYFKCRDEHCSSGIRNEYNLSETNLIDGCGEADKQCLSLQTSPEASASFADWRAAVPTEANDLYASAPIHTMQAGERAILAVLRTLPDEAFRDLPYGSEGLWSKFMKNCRSRAAIDEIIDATKSKRYTRTRIQRMLLCAFLGLRAADLEQQPPYVRVLSFTDRGRAALREMKDRFPLVNAGERPADPEYWKLENRATDLYSLFSEAGPRPAGEEGRLRVCGIP